MCDYSLHHVKTRDAEVGDKLISTTFPGTITRGLADASDCTTAVCLRPGTEVAFAEDVSFSEEVTHFRKAKEGARVARFCQINLDNPYVHHDALEFPDGQIIAVTRLWGGLHITVLQLPSVRAPVPADEVEASTETPREAEPVG